MPPSPFSCVNGSIASTGTSRSRPRSVLGRRRYRRHRSQGQSRPTPPGQRTTALPHWVSSLLISTFKQFYISTKTWSTRPSRRATLSCRSSTRTSLSNFREAFPNTRDDATARSMTRSSDWRTSFAAALSSGDDLSLPSISVAKVYMLRWLETPKDATSHMSRLSVIPHVAPQ
ncbi:hypothetical protein J3A65_004641 [Rhizobium sp. PvP014]|nr:hypothetical protein [Rhizobium sp. PvP014]MBP2532040.1 hypothetical protein [Rhizobium sp. PvP099]